MIEERKRTYIIHLEQKMGEEKEKERERKGRKIE